MSRLSPIILSVTTVGALIVASLFGGGANFAPTGALAQATSFPSSSSSVPPPSSSTPSVSSVEPPGDKGGTGGGPTDLNLARDARDNPMTLVGCTGSAKQPDLYFRNIGNTSIPAGTTITWIVPSTGERGTYTTPKEIKPGDYLPYSAALAAALGKDGTCLAGLLG